MLGFLQTQLLASPHMLVFRMRSCWFLRILRQAALNYELVLRLDFPFWQFCFRVNLYAWFAGLPY